jgi:hypothetical protein
MLCPILKMWEFGQQNSRLKRIKPEITADVLMKVLWLSPVRAHDYSTLVELFIVGDDHAAIARASKIFAREKAEAADGPDASCWDSFVRSRYCLSSILNYMQPVFSGQVHNGIHVAHLPE